jgi:small subunit ribosomal protein S2
MVDTCCDPTPIDYVIPANDDAAKSIGLVMDALCGAVAEGLAERKIEKEKEKEASAEKEGDAPVKKLRSRKPAAAAEEKAE